MVTQGNFVQEEFNFILLVLRIFYTNFLVWFFSEILSSLPIIRRVKELFLLVSCA